MKIQRFNESLYADYYIDKISKYMINLFKDCGYNITIDVETNPVNNSKMINIDIKSVVGNGINIKNNKDVIIIEFWHNAHSEEKDTIISYIEKNTKEYSKNEYFWISPIYIPYNDIDIFMNKITKERYEFFENQEKYNL